jgi:hypothetical protein
LLSLLLVVLVLVVVADNNVHKVECNNKVVDHLVVDNNVLKVVGNKIDQSSQL